jgi:hypothetical protein
MKSTDSPQSPLSKLGEAFYWWSLRDGTDQLNSEEEIDAKLNHIEMALPSFHAAPDSPFFHIAPPTLCAPSGWWPLLKEFPIDESTGRKLLESGFMPFDRDRFLRRGLAEPWYAMSPSRRVVYVDLDYGVLIFEKEQGGLEFAVLNPNEYQRYVQRYQGFENHWDVLTLGQHRAQQLYAAAGETPVLECEVGSRAELDAVIDRLSAGSEKFFNYRLWFRGQNSDRLLPDLTPEAKRGICPWRTVRNSSLVPSLYRPTGLVGRLGNWPEYCRFSIEYGQIASFMNQALDMPSLGEEGRSLAFRSIQGSFFLQHYGFPSTLLDITSDLDVALFFAQYKIDGETKVAVDFTKQHPVIFVFILSRDQDLYFDSVALLEGMDLLRPLRQKCGSIAGASFTSRSTYSKFIGLKIHLTGLIDALDYPTDYIYPRRDEDAFLYQVAGYCEAEGLARLKPFELVAPT